MAVATLWKATAPLAAIPNRMFAARLQVVGRSWAAASSVLSCTSSAGGQPGWPEDSLGASVAVRLTWCALLQASRHVAAAAAAPASVNIVGVSGSLRKSSRNTGADQAIGASCGRNLVAAARIDQQRCWRRWPIRIIRHQQRWDLRPLALSAHARRPAARHRRQAAPGRQLHDRRHLATATLQRRATSVCDVLSETSRAAPDQVKARTLGVCGAGRSVAGWRLQERRLCSAARHQGVPCQGQNRSSRLHCDVKQW